MYDKGRRQDRLSPPMCSARAGEQSGGRRKPRRRGQRAPRQRGRRARRGQPRCGTGAVNSSVYDNGLLRKQPQKQRRSPRAGAPTASGWGGQSSGSGTAPRVPEVPVLPRRRRGLRRDFHLRAALHTTGRRAAHRRRAPASRCLRASTHPTAHRAPAAARSTRPIVPGGFNPLRTGPQRGTGGDRRPAGAQSVPRLRSRGTFSSPLSFRPAETREEKRVSLAERKEPEQKKG